MSPHALLLAYLPVLVLLAATFVYAGVTAGSNAYQIGENYDVSHLWETRERLAALLGYVALAFLPDWEAGRFVLAGASVLLGTGACACLLGLRFDIRLNLRRALGRYYVGTDANTASQDKRVTALGLSGRQFARLKLAGVLVLTAALGVLRWPR